MIHALHCLRESKYEDALRIFRLALIETKRTLEVDPSAESILLGKILQVQAADINDDVTVSEADPSLYAKIFLHDQVEQYGSKTLPASVLLYNIAVTFHHRAATSGSELVSHHASQKARSFYRLCVSVAEGKVAIAALNNLLSLCLRSHDETSVTHSLCESLRERLTQYATTYPCDDDISFFVMNVYHAQTLLHSRCAPMA